MTAPIWQTPAGFLGTLTERRLTATTFVAVGTSTISYSVISGNIPTGLHLNTSTGVAIGTPVAVPNIVTSKFVIRAQSSSGISDRTFSFDVTGPSEPLWVTPAGGLPVGLNGEYYTINQEFVDYNLRAETDILRTGNTLKYFIADNDGQLPPGLSLSQDGRITGYVDDNLKIDVAASIEGGYDDDAYDRYPYEYGVITNTSTDTVSYVKKYSINLVTKEPVCRVVIDKGYDMKSGNPIYIDGVVGTIDPNPINNRTYYVKVVDDTTIALYQDRTLTIPLSSTSTAFGSYISGGTVYWGSTTGVKPQLINKIYQFYVNVTDGIVNSRRLFNIEVLDHNSLRADTTYLSIDSDLIDSSAGYLLSPIWKSKYGAKLPRVSNLGTVRAGRNQVISVYEYDPYPSDGAIVFDWSTVTVNPDIKLITDSQLDAASLPTKNLKGQSSVYFKDAELFPVKGMKIQFREYIANTNATIYTVTGVIKLSNTSGILNIDQPLDQQLPDSRIFYVGTKSQHPPGLSLDPTNGTLYGQLAYEPSFGFGYRFTVKIVKVDEKTGKSTLYNAIGDNPAKIVGKIFTTLTTEPPIGSGGTGLPDPTTYTIGGGSVGDIILVGQAPSPVSRTDVVYDKLLPLMDGTIRAYVYSKGVLQDQAASWVYLGDTSVSNQIYILTILGDIKSSIQWVSTSSLGTLTPGEISEIAVKAVNSNTNYSIEYEIISGQLPTGLTLTGDGTIQGKVVNSGQTYFDFGKLTKKIRPYDGRGNNRINPTINSVGSAFGRIAPSDFVDGIHTMPTGLPNPRTISNIVVAGTNPLDEALRTNNLGLSAWMYVWGQFVTHDIGFEDVGTDTEDISITIPIDDQNLTPGSIIPMKRVTVAPGTGVTSPASAINDTTGWLDASVIYGYTVPPGAPYPKNPFRNPIEIREGGAVATTGKLSTSENNYAPIIMDPTFGPQFLFGDPRANENPDLITIQTLMLREHNWHVDALKAAHPELNGEQLYQQARAVVTAEFQQITYNEWLPNLLGPGAIPEYTGYKPDEAGPIPIEFNAAALRFGHSIVSAIVSRVADDGEDVGPILSFAQAQFMNPSTYEAFGGVDGFCRHISTDLSNELDVYIINDLRNLLNDPPVAIDLASINIQRGRDLGLGTLNETRLALGLPAHTSFSSITSDPVVAANLLRAYGTIDRVELWIGGLAEDHYNGGMLGRTFHEIVKICFIKLRNGDRFWWQQQGFPPSVNDWIKNTTLADIILRNTDTSNVQQQVFVQTDRLGIDTFDPPVAIVGSSPNAVATARTNPYNQSAAPAPLIFDNNNTTIDKNWYVTVRASDVYRLSSVDKEFYITVYQDTLLNFTRIYVKPFLTPEKRAAYRDFINNPIIFDSVLLYRPNDPEFGVQPRIKMIIENGIEQATLDQYTSAMSEYFYRKQFFFGEVKSIKAQDSNGTDVYEIIYVELIDNQMNEKESPSYAVSVGNMQSALQSINLGNSSIISVNERLQPKYMTTLQSDTGVAIGFVKAVPLCYTIPGGSTKILSRIANALSTGEFDFKQYHFDTDRIVVETVKDTEQTGWILNPTDRR